MSTATPGRRWIGWAWTARGWERLALTLPLMARHLDYAWTFAVLSGRNNSTFRPLNLWNQWKPVVAFCKPPRAVWWTYFDDRFQGNREKTDHPWQQAVGEAEHFIRHLCPRGGLVCDPMAGSGTTLVAAARLGRRYLGFEIDRDTAARARARLVEEGLPGEDSA
jgi:site-specific DNA-methyltransferase (adenine-specific)